MAVPAYQQTTSAYAVPAPERARRPQRQSRRATLTRVESRPRTGVFTKAQTAMLVLALVCCGLILYSSMLITTLTDQASQLKSELEDLQSEATYLQTQKDNLMSLDAVEEMAVNQLGMTKLDSSNVEYIELSNPDHVEITDPGFSLKQLWDTISKGASAVLEYLS